MPVDVRYSPPDRAMTGAHARALGWAVVTDPEWAGGALGAGQDDTAALQAAIDSQRPVWFPPTRFIASTLNLRTDTHLIGSGAQGYTAEISGHAASGPFTKLEQLAGTTTPLLRNIDPAAGNSGIHIEGMHIDNTQVTSGDIPAVKFTRAWRSRIIGCSFRTGASTNRTAIAVVPADTSQGSEHIDIMDCLILYGGVVVEGSNSVAISRCEIGLGRYGVVFNVSNFSRVIDTHIYGATEYGIFLRYARQCVITGSNVEENGRHGILLERLCRNNIVNGNVVRNNSSAGAGAWSGITLDSDVSGQPTTTNVVCNNSCYDDGVATQNYGVLIKSSTGSQTNNNAVIGNNGDGNLAGLVSEQAGLSNYIWGPHGVATTTTAPSAGGAGALPATPAGYMSLLVNGTQRQIPYY